MIWEYWLEEAAAAMDVTTTQAGFILSFVITLALMLAIVIASKGARIDYSVPTTWLCGIILFTFLGWVPLWTGSVIAVVLSLFIANKIAGGLK